MYRVTSSALELLIDAASILMECSRCGAQELANVSARLRTGRVVTVLRADVTIRRSVYDFNTLSKMPVVLLLGRASYFWPSAQPTGQLSMQLQWTPSPHVSAIHTAWCVAHFPQCAARLNPDWPAVAATLDELADEFKATRGKYWEQLLSLASTSGRSH